MSREERFPWEAQRSTGSTCVIYTKNVAGKVWVYIDDEKSNGKQANIAIFSKDQIPTLVDALREAIK